MRVFIPSAADLLTDHQTHGEGLIAWSTLDRLAQRGHDVVVCTDDLALRSQPSFGMVDVGRRLRLESIAPLVRGFRVRGVYRTLSAARPFDVAHWLFPQAPDALLSMLPSRTPIVLGPVAVAWPPSASSCRPFATGDLVRVGLRPLFRTLHRRFFNQVTHVLLATPDVHVTTPGNYTIRFVPFGVDTERFRDSRLPDEPRILSVGNLLPHKAFGEVIQAFARVKSQVPSAELTIAGEGPDSGPLRSLAKRLGVGASVKLVGAVPHPEMPSLMAEQSLVVSAARGEPFGMSILEAMASGRAVVAVDQAGPRSLIVDGAGGRLVSGHDVVALSDAMLELLTDSNRLRACGMFNRARAEEHFSLDRFADVIEGVYSEAIGRRSRAA